jgi:hypothetical protein
VQVDADLVRRVVPDPRNSLDTLLAGLSVWNMSDAGGGGLHRRARPHGGRRVEALVQRAAVHQLIELPGQMRVRRRAGAQPASASQTAERIASIADNAIVTADRFTSRSRGRRRRRATAGTT